MVMCVEKWYKGVNRDEAMFLVCALLFEEKGLVNNEVNAFRGKIWTVE